MARYTLQRKVKTDWSPNLAYAIGLIASDGNLSSDGRHMSLTSGEEEMMHNFKNALNLKNIIGKYVGGKEKTHKKYFYIHFGDKVFYQFLNTLGLTPAKSRIIKHVKIPTAYFRDFLRGLFDGDGTFYTFRDGRWPNSFSFKLSIASASIDFIKWLKESLTKHGGVKGYIHKGDGVWNLEYVKGDTKRLFSFMYYSDDILYLKRKYDKIRIAIEEDNKRGLVYLQKPRNAGVA